MTTKTTITLSAIFTLLTPIFTGCDSNTPLGAQETSGIGLSSRYDVEFLEANPTEVAKMPSNLTINDLMTYTPLIESFTINNVNYPKSEGEEDWVLRPLGSGAITIEGLRYIYQRTNLSGTEASIDLSINDKIDGPIFDNGMLSIAQTGAGVGGSLSSQLTTEKYPLESASIFQLSDGEKEAIRLAVLSLGYVAVDMPFAVAVGRGTLISGDSITVQVDVDNIVVLTDRKITHTVTSTNAEILATGEIRGTFQIIDTYYDLAVEASSGDIFYRVIIARIPTFSDILQVQTIRPFAEGTFVLKLDDIENLNPNL